MPNASEVSQAGSDTRRVTSNSLGFSASAVLQLHNLRLSDIVLALVWQQCLQFTSLNQRKDTLQPNYGGGDPLPAKSPPDNTPTPWIRKTNGPYRQDFILFYLWILKYASQLDLNYLGWVRSNPHLRSCPQPCFKCMAYPFRTTRSSSSVL